MVIRNASHNKAFSFNSTSVVNEILIKFWTFQLFERGKQLRYVVISKNFELKNFKRKSSPEMTRGSLSQEYGSVYCIQE